MTSNRPMRIALVCGTTPDGQNAILEYSHLLADALRALDAEVVLHETRRLPDLQGHDAIVLQYNPFLYGRWGFAPRVAASIARLHVRAPRPRIALMVHETYVDGLDWKSKAMGRWQRWQLATLRTSADIVFASTQAWTSMLGEWPPSRRVVHLPVGANIPDRRSGRSRSRALLGARPSDIVLAAFGTAHPSRHLDYIAAAANGVADHRGPTLLLNLGAGAPQIRGLDGAVRVHRPGRLPADELAELLAAADVFLAPFIDGVTTRRGSMMAALQEGVPVVGTSTAGTDDVLRGSPGLRLVPVGEREAFVRTAVTLSDDRDTLTAASRAASDLYASSFDWGVIARRLLDELSRVRP